MIPKWSFNASILFMVWVYWSSNASWASTRQKKLMIKIKWYIFYHPRYIVTVRLLGRLFKSSGTDSLTPARERILYLTFEYHLKERNVMTRPLQLLYQIDILHLHGRALDSVDWIFLGVGSNSGLDCQSFNYLNGEREREILHIKALHVHIMYKKSPLAYV